jgi:hypothetical protein
MSKISPVIAAAMLAFAVAVILGLYGLIDDPSGFWGNLLAELVGALLSLGVAITVVEWLLHRQRDVEWGRVSDLLARTLRTLAQEVAVEFYLRLPQPRPGRLSGIVIPDTGLPAVLRETSDLLDLYVNQPDPDGDPVRLRQAVARQISEIRDNITPRATQIGVDIELVRQLSLLDDAARDWDHALLLHELQELPVGQVWASATAVSRGLANVVRHLDEAGLPRRPQAEAD